MLLAMNLKKNCLGDFLSLLSEKKCRKYFLHIVFPKNRTDIIMLYIDPKATVCSSDADTNFLDIVAKVFQGGRLINFLFLICLEYYYERP